MWFCSYLYNKGVITGEQFANAVSEQLSRRPLLGKIAIEKGKLNIKQVMKVFAVQADDLKKPFGQLAVELGFLTKQDLSQLLLDQIELAPDLADILVQQGAITVSQKLRELHNAHNDLGSFECRSQPLCLQG